MCFFVSKREADAQNSRMVMIWSVKRRVCETIVKSFRDLLFFSVMQCGGDQRSQAERDTWANQPISITAQKMRVHVCSKKKSKTNSRHDKKQTLSVVRCPYEVRMTIFSACRWIPRNRSIAFTKVLLFFLSPILEAVNCS